ncbi:MAG: DUF5103 domain-containing protein [Prevotellaceae bacterium]|jgi:hypothetical protein|nr:DUF5103 domain-containing protein [Prevotellaceae bacterium]
MKKISFLILFCLVSKNIFAQKTFQTKIFDSNIKTLQVLVDNKPLELPVIELNSNDRIKISFDEMSYSSKSFNYKIFHCNADFAQSVLFENEYIDGFYSGIINDFALSENTLTLYANYQFFLPNDDFSFKVSGNYAVIIYEDNNIEKPVATARFSVVEPVIQIVNMKVLANTDIEFNGRFQQVEFEIDNSYFPISNVFQELNVSVFQNRRTDNAAINIKPTFTALYKQTYNHNRALIFEGGNQYRLADFSSEYAFSGEVDKIRKEDEYYNVFLFPAENRAEMSSPNSGGDADGRFLINRRGYDDADITADYMWLHFILPAKMPFADGDIYLLGDLTSNIFDRNSKLDYDSQMQLYHKALFLKQGGYSFLYAFVPKNAQNTQKPQPILQKIEGSYWQTENEYSVFVYYRAFADRFDRLIGVKCAKF